MNAARRDHRGVAARPPRAGAGRRGFVFLLVLVLLIVSSVLLSIGLARGAQQTLAVQNQIRGYQRHHELLGVWDIVDDWLKNQPSASLREHAANEDVIHRVNLGDDLTIVIRVLDGQGTLLARPDRVPDKDAREWLLSILGRLPPDRPDLVRAVGPPQVSILGASDEVLAAIAGDDKEVLAGLTAAREAKALDDASYMNHLTKAGVNGSMIQLLARVATVTPMLFRIEAEVIQGDEVRIYEILTTAGNATNVLELRALPIGTRTYEERKRDRQPAAEAEGRAAGR